MIINSILSFEFPPINELLRWRDVVPGLNKVGLIAIASALIGTLIFLSAARKDPKVAPKGTRNLAEVIVEFIENNIIMQTMGPIGYFKNLMFPPGVPKALYILITPIELISTLIIRPFSLAVRLFANMLAGHLLLVIFALLSEALFQARDKILIPIGVFPFFMLVFLTGFEVLVAFLQAYIFTILAAVYIAGAVHPEH